MCHFGLVYETIFNTIIFETVKKRFESRALACRWWWRGHKSQINFLGMKVGKAEAKIKMIMQAIKQFKLETTVHNECVGLNCMQREVLFWTNHLNLLTRHVWLISGARWHRSTKVRAAFGLVSWLVSFFGGSTCCGGCGRLFCWVFQGHLQSRICKC